MRIDLGASVHSSDGENLGTVDRIVIDPETKAVQQFILQHGFLTQTHKIVDIDMVVGQEGDTVRLNQSADQVAKLPDYVQERFVQVPEHDVDAIPFIIPTAMGAGSYLYGAPYMGRGYEGSQDSIFDAAPAVAPVIEEVSNVSEMDVMISEGTDVYSVDGDKVGSVNEVLLSPDGQIQGFVVSSGLIFKKHYQIPIAWVDTTGDEQIRLNVGTAEAESTAASQ